MTLAIVLGVVAGRLGSGGEEPAPNASPSASAEGPAAEYETVLAEQADALATERLDSLRALRAAGRDRQADAVRRLALAYSAAGTELADLRPPASALADHRRVAGALKRAATAYRQLAAAAARRDRAAYERARKAVRRAESSARQTFRVALGASGGSA